MPSQFGLGPELMQGAPALPGGGQPQHNFGPPPQRPQNLPGPPPGMQAIRPPQMQAGGIPQNAQGGGVPLTGDQSIVQPGRGLVNSRGMTREMGQWTPDGRGAPKMPPQGMTPGPQAQGLGPMGAPPALPGGGMPQLPPELQNAPPRPANLPPPPQMPGGGGIMPMVNAGGAPMSEQERAMLAQLMARGR